MPLVETVAALLAGNAVVLNLPLQMVTLGTWIDDVSPPRSSRPASSLATS